MEYEIRNHEVLSVEEVKGKTRTHIVKKHHTFAKHIKAQVAGNVVTFTFEDWQENPLPLENVICNLSGDIESQEITVTDGTLELAGAPGSIILVETINSNVQNIRIEVVL